MTSGLNFRISPGRSSIGETTAVVTPAASSAALRRTAGSTSVSVMRTFIASSVRLDFSGEHFAGVLDDSIQRSEAVAHSIRRSGQIHYQRFSADSGDSPRERGTGEAGDRYGAQQFGDAGRLPIDYRARRLRRDVGRRKSGSTGRENQIHRAAVAPLRELPDYLDCVVG